MEAKRSRKRIAYLIALLLLFVVMSVMLAFYGGDILDALQGLDVRYAVLAVLCYAGVHLSWGIKWYLLVKAVAPKARLPSVLLANMAGNFINITTFSGRLAGEPFRATVVAKRSGARFSDILATTMVDKMGMTVAMIFLLVPILIYAYLTYAMPPLLQYILIIFFIFWIFLGASLFLVFKSMKRWKAEKIVDLAFVVTKFFRGTKPFNKKKIAKRISNGIRSFRESFKDLARNPLAMTLDLILGCLSYLYRFAAAYMIFLAIGHSMDILTVAVVVHITFIIGLMSQLPGMIGISEFSMTGLYSAMKVNPGVAVAAAFLSQLNMYFFELGLGYVALFVLNFITVGKKNIGPLEVRVRQREDE